MSLNIEYFKEHFSKELVEASLTVDSFTGKTDDGSNQDSVNEPNAEKGSLRSRIKIKVIGSGRYGGDKVKMTGSEEDLITYAKRHLGGEGDTLSAVQSSLGESKEIVEETTDEELTEASLKIGMFTGKVENNKTAEKLGIKIKVVSSANPGNNVIFTGSEEALIKYARKYLGAEEGDTLNQIQKTLKEWHLTGFQVRQSGSMLLVEELNLVHILGVVLILQMLRVVFLQISNQIGVIMQLTMHYIPLKQSLIGLTIMVCIIWLVMFLSGLNHHMIKDHIILIQD